MGVGLMERARIARQPAHLLLASEFGSATLHEKGSGEYDPSFIITKLGAKVNRIVAAGLLERLELRETSNDLLCTKANSETPPVSIISRSVNTTRR